MPAGQFAGHLEREHESAWAAIHHKHQHRNELLARRVVQHGRVRRTANGMVMDLTGTGARTAKVQWGARGWVVHHNTDLWRASAPIDGPAYGMCPPAERGCARTCGNIIYSPRIKSI